MPCLLAAAAAAAAAGCSRKRPVGPTPVSTATVGQCADPARSGTIGDSPRLQRADRDLDGDRRAEVVAADRGLCTEEGNCYWNVFTFDERAGCHRYAGTIAGSVIDLLARRGDDGFHHLRAWWQLTDGSRVLLQEYHFRHGGYRMAEAMVCRQEGDDRLLCASDH
ncbi:MAG TPA: hypothetical protein VKZ63_00930 [Kofleriaceae bacterium]|nr:hypothetical protein [Kofleriaceae bacterium]